MPWFLARLRAQPWQALVGVLAIASALSLILLFEGFRAGIYQQMRDFPERLPADLIVAPAGVENLSASRSLLGPQIADQVAAHPDVASAHVLGGIPQILEHKGRTSPAYVVVYRESGGPTTLIEGREGDGIGEVVLDKGLTTAFELQVGDTFEALDHQFTVVGVSERTSAMFTPFVFIRYRDLKPMMARELTFLGVDPTLGFLLVRARPGVEPQELRADLADVLVGVSIHTPAELAEADERMARGMMAPVMNFLVTLAWGLGLAVVGLTTYASVLQRLVEIATAKALGATEAWLAAGVVAETVVLALPAYGLAVLAAVGIGAGIEHMSPDFLVLPLERGGLLRTAVAAAVFPVLGSLGPLIKVARLDAASVFRS